MSVLDGFYYIQNRGYEGNCLKWWRVDGHGYTVDLREAWKVSREKALNICADRPTEDIAWPAEIVEKHVQWHVTQLLEMKPIR